jgi:methylmalonyl-CoA mutase cobalamin-binding subunit
MTILNQRSADFATSAEYKASQEVNRTTAAEGMVLLKNEAGALPLSLTTSNKVALVTSSVAQLAASGGGGGFGGGITAVSDLVIEGGGSAAVIFDPATAKTLARGLADGGFTVTGSELDANVTQASATAAAVAADVAVFVLSRTSSEGADNVQTSFDLSATEKAAFEAYVEAFKLHGKKVVVLINAGASVNTAEFRAGADAILEVWLPGAEGANAIADVLSGKVNPSGKLTQTFPETYADSPSIAMATADHAGQTWATNPVYYDEGVYVGYRYFDTFGKEDRVAYPFGHGLSYTTFEYSELKLDKAAFDGAKAGETVKATATVKNTGGVAGRAVVEFYLGAGTYEAEGRPVKELKHYAKTGLLQPGESATVEYVIPLRDLQYFDDGNPTNDLSNVTYNIDDGTGAGWTVADGTVFTVTAGGTSDSKALAEAGASATATFVYNPSETPATPSPSPTPPAGATTVPPVAPTSSTGSGGTSSGGGGSTGATSTPKPSASPSATYGGPTVDTGDGAEPVDNGDGSVTLPDGGSVSFDSGAKADLPPGSVVGSDGSMKVPAGGRATITTPDGKTYEVPGGFTIVPDDASPLGFAFRFDGNPFDDVDAGDWFFGDVAFAFLNDLMIGTGDATFEPQTPLSRGMIVTILGRMDGADVAGAVAASPFEDVDQDAYYAPYIEWAKNNGIVVGVGENRYEPDRMVLREEMVAIFTRYLAYIGAELEDIRAGQTFRDETLTEPYARASVDAMYRAGIVNGVGDNRFAPKDSATRAEAAAIMHRLALALELDYLEPED